MGFGRLKPQRAQNLNSVRSVGDLRKIGRKVAEEIREEHLGGFVPAGGE